MCLKTVMSLFSRGKKTTKESSSTNLSIDSSATPIMDSMPQEAEVEMRGAASRPPSIAASLTPSVAPSVAATVIITRRNLEVAPPTDNMNLAGSKDRKSYIGTERDRSIRGLRDSDSSTLAIRTPPSSVASDPEALAGNMKLKKMLATANRHIDEDGDILVHAGNGFWTKKSRLGGSEDSGQTRYTYIGLPVVAQDKRAKDRRGERGTC